MDASVKRALSRDKSKFYQAIRNFFNHQDYVEVETPILSAELIPESAIEVFKTEWVSHHGPSKTLYLTPSPEIYMKQLISEGIGDCFQITKSFRNAEEVSPRHLSEFTMLEWYAMNKNYKDNLHMTQNLLQSLAPLASPETRHLFTKFQEITMQQLFLDSVDVDLNQCTTLASFKEIASAAGFSEYTEKSHNWETLFHYIFVGHIENNLPRETTVFITNYPAQIPTTAKKVNQHYERWEVYINGIEIANCYTEETRYEQMQQLFQAEGQLKQQMLVPHPVNFDYLSCFNTETHQKFPACSGVALGVDRLFALAQNLDAIVRIC